MKYLTFIFGLFFLPLSALAITHNYTCSDFSTMGSDWSCASNVFTSSGVTGNSLSDQATPRAFELGNDTTWYLSATISGTGRGEVNCEGSGNCDPWQYLYQSVSDMVIPQNGSAPSGLYIRSDNAAAGGGYANFSGTISNLCITDTIGGCATAPTSTATTTNISSMHFDTFTTLFFAFASAMSLYFIIFTIKYLLNSRKVIWKF